MVLLPTVMQQSPLVKQVQSFVTKFNAVILLLGAEVNAFFAEGVRAIPNDVATFVSLMAAQLHKDVHTPGE